MSGRLRIVVCDDHPIVRSGLVALLALQPDMEVVGEAEDGHAAVDLCRRLQPRLVLMDLSMPLLNGVDATAHIRQACPDTRVLVLSMYDDGRITSYNVCYTKLLRAQSRGWCSPPR